MIKMVHTFCVLAFTLLTLVEAQYTCGTAGTSYLTNEESLLCLVFDSLGKKVVFNPVVDKFTSLQIQGLFSKFSSSTGNLTVTAVSNGIVSRPAVFKINSDVAPLLNLVVNLEKGVVSSLTWKNSCNGG